MRRGGMGSIPPLTRSAACRCGCVGDRDRDGGGSFIQRSILFGHGGDLSFLVHLTKFLGLERLMITAHESAQPLQEVPELIPARMLNEFAYCPRLAYLEWVQGEFADNLERREGRLRHRRVDRPANKPVPDATDGDVKGSAGFKE